MLFRSEDYRILLRRIGYRLAGRLRYRLPGRWMEKLFLLVFRLRKAGSSKSSASRQRLRTDRRLMPWRYLMLYAVALAGTFWGFQVFSCESQCAPNPGYEAEN